MTHWLLAWALLLAGMAPAAAHRASDAFVTLEVRDGRVDGSWEVALRDFEAAIATDRDRNGEITWGELKAALPQAAEKLPPFLQIAAGDRRCAVRIKDLQINHRLDGPYAWFGLSGACPQGAVSVRYRFLFDIDPGHRAILALTGADDVARTAVLSPAADRLALEAGESGRLAQFVSYLREGITHIWAGYDHSLFLLSLLLPCVLVRDPQGWRAVGRGKDAIREVVIVVTAFTVAHSITLSLSVLEVLRLPSHLVESVIALTVVGAALNNVWPLVTRQRAAVAFTFGLIHGCGFASALGEVGLPTGLRLLGLAGFNAGVELGQLAIVAAVMPLLYLLRATRFYQRGVLQAGSLGIAALAAAWFAQRALGSA